MNRTDRGILYGMLFGDGNLYIATNNFGVKYTKLTIGHSPRQREFLEHKCELLHSIFGGKKPKIYSYKSLNKKLNKEYENLQTVKTNKYFNQMHRLLYPLGKKVYTRQTLDYLTDHGLALWFMDDGSCRYSKRKDGNVKSFSMTISTYCDEQQVEIIQQWFSDKYGLLPKRDLDKRNNLYSIRFNTQDSLKLRDIISPFTIPSMEYKIGIFQERQTSYRCPEEDDIVQQ